MANNDFTLQFGSNAGTFAERLTSQLNPAIDSIYNLAQALADYDSQVDRSRGVSGSPLASLFDQLDRATASFSRLTSEFTTFFGSAIRSVEELRADLSAVVTDLRDISAATAKAGGTVRRTATSTVSPEDESAARTAQSNNARNALKRVSDINTTVARNAGEAANALKELGQTIRTLRLQATTESRALQAQQVAGGIPTAGGGNNFITLTDAQIARLGIGNTVTAQVAAVGADSAKADSATHAAAAEVYVEQAIKRRNVQQIGSLDEPARPGKFFVNNPNETFPVGFGIKEGETFAQYNARTAAARIRENEALSRVPQLPPEFQRVLDVFRTSGGRSAEEASRVINSLPGVNQALSLPLGSRPLGEESPDEKRLRDLIRRDENARIQLEHGRSISTEGGTVGFGENLTPVKATELQDLRSKLAPEIQALRSQITQSALLTGLAPADTRGAAKQQLFRPRSTPGALTEQQLSILPAALKAQSERNAAIAQATDEFVRTELANDPLTSFDQLAAQTKRRAAEIDRDEIIAPEEAGITAEPDRVEVQGARARDAARAQAAELFENRGAQIGARRDAEARLFGPGTGALGSLGTVAQQRAEEAAREDQIIRDVDNQVTKTLREHLTTSSRLSAAQSRGEQLQGLQAALGSSDLSNLTTRQNLADQYRTLSGGVVGETEEALKRANSSLKRLTTQQETASPEKAAALEPKISAAVSKIQTLQDRLRTLDVVQNQIDTTTGNPIRDPRTGRVLPEAGAPTIAKIQTAVDTLIRENVAQQHNLTEAATKTQAALDQETVERSRAIGENTQAVKESTGTTRQRVVAEKASQGDVAGVRIFRGENAEAVSAAEARHGNLQGRFFTEDLPTAQEYAGPGGRVVSTTISQKQFEAARERAVQEKVLEGLVVPAHVARNATALEEAVNVATGGGGGRRPPTPPTIAAGGEEEEPKPGRPAVSRAAVGDHTQFLQALQEETRAALEEARAIAQITEQTKILTQAQREQLVIAGEVYRQDPLVDAAFRGGRSGVAKEAFGQGVGLPTSVENRKFLDSAFGIKGTVNSNIVARQAASTGEAASQEDVFARALNVSAEASDKKTQALLRLEEVQERYNELVAREKENPGSVSYPQAVSATRQVQAAQQAVNRINAEESNEGGAFGRAIFGKQGFLDGQLRHFGQAIENIAGYTLVFSGFEQLKQLVNDGIQADAAFVRLQASLTATGRATGNLRAQLQGVSSATAQSLPAIVEAASELTGVFSNNNDLVAATKIAGELANISQGTLTAKEAAIGLRDVTDAYGISGAAAIQSVGDHIAALSQVTGVSVKDIVEGTTQLAQEAKRFGLSQQQASVLSAYVTRSTGETGESAAEQVSRILSTLNTGKVQTLLEKTRVPGTDKFVATAEQFGKGDIGDVLQSLLANFDKLTPSSQQAITALVGSGRQARAFAGLLRDASEAAKQFNSNESDTGALAKQNQQFLDSLAGTLKSLENDFRNLGATLQQLGVFDLLGLFAKTLDELLKVFNTVFGGIANILNSNPLTKYLKDAIVLVGELAIGFKLLGGIIGSGLGRSIQPGRATRAVTNRIGEPVYSQSGEIEREFAPVTFGGALTGLRRAPGRFVSSLSSLPERARSIGSSAFNRLQQFVYPTPRSQEEAVRRDLQRAASASRVPSSVSELASESEAASSRVGRLTNGMNRFARSAAVTTVAFVALSYAIDRLAKAAASDSELASNEKTVSDQLGGETAAEAKARSTGALTDPTQAQKNVAAVAGQNNSPFHFALNQLKKFDPLASHAYLQGEDPESINGVSTGFGSALSGITNLVQGRLRDARGNADALNKANVDSQKDFKDFNNYINSLGLNSHQKAYAQAEFEQVESGFKNSYGNLLGQAEGIQQINQLSAPLLDNLITALEQSSQLTSETLQKFPEIAKLIEDQAGLPQGSNGRKNLKTALSGRASFTDRLRSQVKGDNEIIRDTLLDIHKNYTSGDLVDPNNAGAQADLKRLTQAETDRQSTLQSLRQTNVQNAEQLASLAVSRGNNGSAVNDLQRAVKYYQEINSHLKHDDPAYIANLQQILADKQQIAQLESASAIDAANLAAASSNDPLVKARDSLHAALLQQAAVFAQPGGGSKADRNAAAIQVAQSRISRAQAAADQQESQFQLSIAGHVSNLTDLQKQINDDVRQEALYADGTLKNSQQYLALKKQEASDRLALLQAEQEQANAETELQIAQLTARGKAGDLQKAARLQLQEAKQKLAQYLSQPGAKRGDAQSDQLQAAIVQARRNAFDVALNAQLDTLDFQAQTYKITSEQEIQALQEILKNKQLTLAEQRSITLKIKDLQQSIRQELIGGGFNIPSNITLPTAYEVRRSLGGGFNGNQTTVENTTNNNQKINVSVQVNTDSSQHAEKVANHVVKKINDGTSKSVRANSSTPRLVAVG